MISRHDCRHRLLRRTRRVVVTLAAGGWHRQAELLADATALLG
jgi:hypothetical protein